VLESRQDQGEGPEETPAPASGGHPFFDREAWDRWGQCDDIGAEDDDDEESLNDGSGSQDEDNVDHSHHNDDRVPPGQVHTPDYLVGILFKVTK